MSAATARLVWISLLARLRAGGLAPWLTLVLWGAAATASEPDALRTFGIKLSEQAIWVGGTALAAMLLLASGSFAARAGSVRLVANLLILLLVAVAQGALCIACDVAFQGTTSAYGNAVLAASFFWVWAPMAAAFAVHTVEGPQSYMRWPLVIACLGVSTAAAVAAWGERSATTLVAPGLGLLACLLAMVAKRAGGSMIAPHSCG